MKYYNLIKDTKSPTAVYPYIFEVDKVKNNFDGLAIINSFFNNLENCILAKGETLSIIVQNCNFYTTYLIGEVISQCAMRKINLEFLYYNEHSDEFEKQEFRFYLWRDEY